jgi:hypothetical protein
MLDPVKRKIIQAARLFDIPADWALAIAWVESRLNPQAVNKLSGAKGLFQFVPSTAKEYNIDPLNVAESCAAAMMMLAKNKRKLEAQEREATLTALYLCHQQGFEGYYQIEIAAKGSATLLERRKANMRGNIYVPGLLKDSYSDAEFARVFILWWTGALGQAQVEARR